MKTEYFLCRYPHGWFVGGMISLVLFPSLTISGWAYNNRLVIEYDL